MAEYLSTDPNAGVGDSEYLSVDPNEGIAPKIPGNIDINNRPVVNNSDGTVSTEKSFSIGTDKGEVLIPQVVGGKMLSKEDAIKHYKDTGEHLGIFSSVNEANTYAEALHNRQGNSGYLSTDPNAGESVIKKAGQAVLDYLDLNKEAQAPEQRSIGAKILTGAGEALKKAIPHGSAGEVALGLGGFATPAVGSVVELANAPAAIQDAFRNRNLPGQGPIYEAEQTPPWSQERFNVGADITGQMLMAGAIGKGLKSEIGPRIEPETPLPVAREPVPENLQPRVETAPPAAEAANVPPVEQPLQPEPAATPEMMGPGQADIYFRREGKRGFKVMEAHKEAIQSAIDEGRPYNQEAAAFHRLQPEPAAAEVKPLEVSDAVEQVKTNPESIKDPAVLTSIKNEITNAQRIAKGLEPAEEFAKADFPGLWDQAKAERAEQPTIGRTLVESINKNPRPLKDAENAHLLQEQIAAEAEHDMAMDNLNRNPGNEDAIARYETASNYLQDVYNADKTAGRQNSLGLSSRQYMADRELNLARMAQLQSAAQKGKPLNPEQLSKVTDLHDQMKAVKDKLTDNEKRQKIYKASLKTRINQLEQRVLAPYPKYGDVSRLTREPLETLSAENLDLKARYSKLKSDFDKMVFETQLKNRNVVQRFLQTGHELLSIPRSIVASMDLSALRRQGGLFFMSHPLRSLRIFKNTLAAASEHGYFKHLEALKARPNFKNGSYRQGGLSLTDVSDPKLSHMEEMYANRWTAKIPGVSHSARVYTAFLNQLRAESFDALGNSLSRNGALSKAEKQVIGNFTNVWTGRGALAGRYEPATVALADTFFAPRYIASRFQAIIGQPIWTTRGGFEGTGRVRTAIAKEYARTLIGYGVTYGLVTAGAVAFGKRLGDVVDFNPYSADFGKIKFGNTRLDLLSGLAQTTVFAAREIGGKQTNLKGETKDIRGPNVKFKDPNGYDVASRFLRSKLAPVPGFAANLFSGEDYVGDPTGAISDPSTYLNVSSEFPYIGGELPKLVTPLSGGDIYDAIKEQGVPAGAALGMLAIFGDSVQTYSPKVSASDLKKLNRPPGASAGTPSFLRKPKADKTIGETQ